MKILFLSSENLLFSEGESINTQTSIEQSRVNHPKGLCGQARSHPLVKMNASQKRACKLDIVVHVEFGQIKMELG